MPEHFLACWTAAGYGGHVCPTVEVIRTIMCPPCAKAGSVLE
jgi:hypothetical protein